MNLKKIQSGNFVKPGLQEVVTWVKVHGIGLLTALLPPWLSGIHGQEELN